MSGTNVTPAPGPAPILPSDQQGTPSAAPTEPRLFAGKYKSVEEMEKGYKELEKKLGAPPPAPPAPQQKGVVPPVPDASPAPAAGLNFDEFTAEFAATGSLSEASYEKLVNSGIPKPLVDAYIEGQVATAEKKQNEVFATVGGKEAYDKMIAWASSALTADEKIAYNASLGGDLNAVKWAVAGLRQKYEAVNGRTPKLVQGETAAAGGGQYESRAQIMVDMKDPRYQKDPAFRAAVASKIKNSKL